MQLKKHLFLITFILIITNINVYAANNVIQATQVIPAPSKLPANAQTVSGSCWTSSIASNQPNAWRCMVGNSIYDPCFTTDVKNKLICGYDPQDPKAAFILKLTKPLPAAENTPSKQIRPWMLELADGNMCQPFTGTVPFAGKISIPYGCNNNLTLPKNCWTGLIDSSIKPGKIWIAKEVVYCSSAKSADVIIKNKKLVNIKTVWQ